MRHLLVTGIAALSILFPARAQMAQTKTLSHGPQRIEITLERKDGDVWKAIDPGLVLSQNDRVRFRMRANFDGYLYVTNYSTSDKYEQLFPREETGENNRIVAGREYVIPATSAAFRIAGPAGYEITYWLMSPVPLSGAPLTGASTGFDAAPAAAPKPPGGILLPRCDDEIFRARGECVDSKAGARGIKDSDVPEPLASQHATARELMFERKQNTSVIASQSPLTGPALYEFRLAHK
jgi:hypothetical protein